ncbi:MAG: helix-turn-helix domain-containing protein [Pleurocapsa minor HA4230-MV1]|nr:helix-turn-helix domain-containing protein [Pleurocapsa minor HA4230-MV1]
MTNQDHEHSTNTFKQLLSKRKTTAYQIAKKTGIDKTYLSKLSSGAIAKPGKDKLIKIAQALNIELEQLQKVFSEPEEVIEEFGLDNMQSNFSQVITPLQDWGSAPTAIVCYERSTEINTIKQWIEEQDCRLVTLFGLGGIGKTTVAMEIARQLKSEFDYVFWRTLSEVSLIEIIIQDALRLFSNKKPPITITHQITKLLQYLQKHRCLLILDGIETILATGSSLQPYQNGCQAYGELLRQVAQKQHQSCLLLVSDEKPRDIAIWESTSALIHSYQLQGSTKVGYRILADKQIPQSSAWNELITVYQGHPLALKIVATLINELFNGDVSQFLRQNTLFLGDLQFILHQQYQRLGDREKNILKTLAETDKPLSLQELTLQYATQLRCSEIMNCLNSLKRRSLLEIDQNNRVSFYSIQPVVRKYIKSQS